MFLQQRDVLEKAQQRERQQAEIYEGSRKPAKGLRHVGIVQPFHPLSGQPGQHEEAKAGTQRQTDRTRQGGKAVIGNQCDANNDVVKGGEREQPAQPLEDRRQKPAEHHHVQDVQHRRDGDHHDRAGSAWRAARCP